MPPLPDEPRYQIGDKIAGRYRLEVLLGAGGFGEVYRAMQLDLGRQVALKLLLHDRMGSKTNLRRFLREAQLARELEHPNTVRLLDFGQTDQGLPYIAYQLLRGCTLKTLLEEQRSLSPSRTIHIISQVLKSLMEAHEHGIIHRDIKPDNIFMTDFEGAPDFVKVLDLGIAKPVGPGQQDTAVTAEDEIIGTPSYMAPEQILGEPVSPATDLYAIGLVMAEMLAGQVIVGGARPIQILAEHLSDDPVRIPKTLESSPLFAVIRRATAKSLSDRYGIGGQMLGDLSQMVESMSSEQLEVLLSSGQGGFATATTEGAVEGSWSGSIGSMGASGVALAATVDSSGAGLSDGVKETAPSLARRLLVLGSVVILLFIAGLAATVGAGSLLRRRSTTPDITTVAVPPIVPPTVAPTDAAHQRADSVIVDSSGTPLLLEPLKLSELTPELLGTQLRKARWVVGLSTPISQNANTVRAEGVNIQILKGDNHGSVTFFRYESRHHAAVFEKGFRQTPAAVGRVDRNLIYIMLFAGYDSSAVTDVAVELLEMIVVLE